MGKGENAGIFSFFRNVFYPIIDRNDLFSKNRIVVCKCFQFGLVQKFVVWERVKVISAFLVISSFLSMEVKQHALG